MIQNFNRVNIRVYRRGVNGTILIWNTDPLTPGQRKNAVISTKSVDSAHWELPEVVMPDTKNMEKVLDDGKTDTAMIVHSEENGIDKDTAFDVRIVFGTNQDGYKEAVYRVAPAGKHTVYTKPERIVVEGKTVYAENAHVVSMEDSVIEKIAKAFKKEMGK